MVLTCTPSFVLIGCHLLFNLEGHLLCTIFKFKKKLRFKHLINDIIIDLRSS